MVIPRKKIEEPTDIGRTETGDVLYVPKHPVTKTFPDRILVVVGESNNSFYCRDRDATFQIIKTEYLDTWFTATYYDWVYNIFTEYGYLLGWCILEKRYPQYNHFYKMILKRCSPEVYLIIKDRVSNAQI